MIRKRIVGTPTRTNIHAPLLGGGNLFGDPTFTSGITGWSALSSATLAHETSIGNFSTTSLKVTAANATSGASFTTESVAAGSKRIFKFWVRGNSTSAGKFVRGKITANGDASSQDTVAIKLTTSFQEVWCTYVIPATGTISLSVYGVDLANTEIFYIDNVTCDTYQIPVLTVSNRNILYNGSRIWWRGCNYNNTPTSGSINNFATEEKMLRVDAQDLVDQGVNCVRIYGNTYDRNDFGRGLDVFYQYGLAVQFWYFIWIQSSDYTQSTGTVNRAATIDDYELWVSRLKDHPALVAYFFGSEGNFHITAEGDGENNTETDWFTLVNDCSAAAKLLDPSRLTSTSNGGVADLATESLVPDMDFWGYTIYRGSEGNVHRFSSINTIRTEILEKTSKPTVLTELGTGIYAASFPNSEHAWGQAISDLRLMRSCEIFSDVIQGVMYFQFSDNSGDTSRYGKGEAIAQGSSTPRPKRISWHVLKNYYLRNALPIY